MSDLQTADDDELMLLLQLLLAKLYRSHTRQYVSEPNASEFKLHTQKSNTGPMIEKGKNCSIKPSYILINNKNNYFNDKANIKPSQPRAGCIKHSKGKRFLILKQCMLAVTKNTLTKGTQQNI